MCLYNFLSECKEAFNVFDKNGDGTITFTEFGKAMRAMGQNPIDAELKAIINDLDKDGVYFS